MVDLELPAFICIDFAAPGLCAVEDDSGPTRDVALDLELNR